MEWHSQPNHLRAFYKTGPGALAHVQDGGIKIAAFDLSKSGEIMPISGDDWMWLDGAIPAKLRELASQRYVVAIISNQYNILFEAERLKGFMRQLDHMASELDIVLALYVAASLDECRKPGTALWDVLLADCGVARDHRLAESFYVGDAAGRVGDWAGTDSEFASNLGVAFYTPEEFFQLDVSSDEGG
ncbi:hypothetical protein F66182_846 [Fusarium sp. NRRL 66182]|nr:hypothetical protein F66182_846 [Fusarium sp. NRRL 66182]